MIFDLHEFLEKKISFLLIFIVAIYLLSGCAITSSQMKTAKVYFLSLESVDDYCQTVSQSLSTVKYEREKLFSVQYQNDSMMVKALTDSYRKYYTQLNKIDSFAENVMVFGSYISGLKECLPKPRVISGNDKKIVKSLEDFFSNLPLGIGFTVYKTLYDLFHYLITGIKVPSYRKKVKNYITKGTEIIPVKSDVLHEKCKWFVIQLETEMDLLKKDYIGFLQLQKDNKTVYDYYNKYNPIFLRLYNLAYTARELSVTLSELFPITDENFKYLFEHTRERKKMKNGLPGFEQMNSIILKADQQATQVKKSFNNQ